jgi:hypothetical protein
MQVVNTTAMATVLRKAGVSAEIAEAHATILADTVAMSYSGLATKHDILATRDDILRLQAMIEAQKSTVEAQFARVEAKVEAQIAQSQNKIILFVVGAALALGGLYLNSIRAQPVRAADPPALQVPRQPPPLPIPAQPAPAPPAPQK